MSGSEGARPLRPKEGVLAFSKRLVAMGATTRSFTDDGRTGRVTVLADFAGKCERPIPFRGEYREGGTRGEVTMKVRCRRCPGCLRVKAAQWGYRCVAENLAHPHEDETKELVRHRTFFVTLTLAPVPLYIMEARARAKYVEPWEVITEDGEVKNLGEKHLWDTLSPHQQSLAVFREVGAECTKYLKRVRKQLEGIAKLRYFLTHEYGEANGREHVHALVHVKASVPNKWDMIQLALIQKWRRHELRPGVPLGIADAEHIRDPERGGWYVSKYISKSSHARARASRAYGRSLNATAPNTP